MKRKSSKENFGNLTKQELPAQKNKNRPSELTYSLRKYVISRAGFESTTLQRTLAIKQRTDPAFSIALNLMPIVLATAAALDPVTDSPVRKLRQHLRSSEFGAATLEVKKHS